MHPCPNGQIEVDAEEFEAAARDALSTRRRADIEATLRLYPGDLLPDDRYADWAGDRRESLVRLHSNLHSELASRLEEGGDLTAAADVLGRLILQDPADERSARALMRMPALAGYRTAAIRQYETPGDGARAPLVPLVPHEPPRLGALPLGRVRRGVAVRRRPRSPVFAVSG